MKSLAVKQPRQTRLIHMATPFNGIEHVIDSRVNIEGVYVQLGYAITDAVVANLTYGHGWQIDHDFGTGGVGEIGTIPVDDYNLFQADLSFRF